MSACNLFSDAWGYGARAFAEACAREQEKKVGTAHFVAKGTLVQANTPTEVYTVEECNKSKFSARDKEAQCKQSLQRIKQGRK